MFVCTRRFFDSVKEALTSQTKETWTEFVKCLDLFGNSAISREQLMHLVRGLFGPGDSDLFSEFSRLLSNREDYLAHKQDLWYAVPMSEIDFNQCRKCTPSYR